MGKGIKYGSGGGGASVKNGFLRKFYATAEDIPGGMFAKIGQNTDNAISLSGSSSYQNFVKGVQLKSAKNLIVEFEFTTGQGNYCHIFLTKSDVNGTVNVLSELTVMAYTAAFNFTLAKLDENRVLCTWFAYNSSTSQTKAYSMLIHINNDVITAGNINTITLGYSQGSSANSDKIASIKAGADRVLLTTQYYIYLLGISGDTVSIISSIRDNDINQGLNFAALNDNSVILTGGYNPWWFKKITVENDEITIGSKIATPTTTSVAHSIIHYENGRIIMFNAKNIMVYSVDFNNNTATLDFTVNVPITINNLGNYVDAVRLSKGTYLIAYSTTGGGVYNQNYIVNLVINYDSNTASTFIMNAGNDGTGESYGVFLMYPCHIGIISEAAFVSFNGYRHNNSGYTYTLGAMVFRQIIENTPGNALENIALTFNKCTATSPGKAYTIK